MLTLICTGNPRVPFFFSFLRFLTETEQSRFQYNMEDYPLKICHHSPRSDNCLQFPVNHSKRWRRVFWQPNECLIIFNNNCLKLTHKLYSTRQETRSLQGQSFNAHFLWFLCPFSCLLSAQLHLQIKQIKEPLLLFFLISVW